MDMSNRPLYQTRATIVLYPATRRKRLATAMGMIAGIILTGMVFVFSGLAGGQTLPADAPAATDTAVYEGDSARSALIDSVATALPATKAQSQTQPVARHYQVVGVGELGLLLRPEPSTAVDPVETLPEGAIVTGIGADVTGADREWRHVRDSEGVEGWIAAEYTRPTVIPASQG